MKFEHKTLLLNVSNMETYPVYPYAFIQVLAIARRAGVQVVCKDLLGIAQEEWGNTIQDLITRHDPEMFLITLRNTIRIAHQQGFDRSFNDCSIIKNLRVFDYEDLDASTLELAYSISPDLDRVEYKQLHPSFVYPPALLELFGTEKRVLAMFNNIAETYLSMKY